MLLTSWSAILITFSLVSCENTRLVVETANDVGHLEKTPHGGDYQDTVGRDYQDTVETKQSDEEVIDLKNLPSCEGLRCWGANKCGVYIDWAQWEQTGKTIFKKTCQCNDDSASLPNCRIEKTCERDCGENAYCDVSGTGKYGECECKEVKGLRHQRWPKCCAENCGKFGRCSGSRSTRKKRICKCKYKGRGSWSKNRKDERCRKCKSICGKNAKCKKTKKRRGRSGHWRCICNWGGSFPQCTPSSNGQWGTWSPWKCTNYTGGADNLGLSQVRERKCDDPLPVGTGSCEGKLTESEDRVCKIDCATQRVGRLNNIIKTLDDVTECQCTEACRDDETCAFWTYWVYGEKRDKCELHSAGSSTQNGLALSGPKTCVCQ